MILYFGPWGTGLRASLSSANSHLGWDADELLLGLGHSQPEQEQPACDGELYDQATDSQRRRPLHHVPSDVGWGKNGCVLGSFSVYLFRSLPRYDEKL